MELKIEVMADSEEEAREKALNMDGKITEITYTNKDIENKAKLHIVDLLKSAKEEDDPYLTDQGKHAVIKRSWDMAFAIVMFVSNELLLEGNDLGKWYEDNIQPEYHDLMMQ